MRLFVAVDFPAETKVAMNRLQKTGVTGDFTHTGNLYLTLAFIGESTRVAQIKTAMSMVNALPFELSHGNRPFFAQRASLGRH